MKLDTHHNVAVVGPIPRGLPTPSIPKFFLIRDVFFDAIAIIIVQGSIHMSMIKIMSQRLNYVVCENQEIYTVGFVLTLSGFLPIYPTSNALSRPQILVECGATSQVRK
jgi:MFS superfamily sulfate permease-like transporter